MRTYLSLALSIWMILTGAVAAQDTETDAAALAKKIQNPLAAMVTLPLQANYNTGFGEFDRTFFNLNVQPVVPYPGEKLNVILRSIMPINSAPMGETDSVSGLGDTHLSFLLSPAGSEVTWGLGPIFGLPTASNPEILGSGKWGVGPTGIIFVMAGKFTTGAWSAISGRSPATRIATTTTDSCASTSSTTTSAGAGPWARSRSSRPTGMPNRATVDDPLWPSDFQGNALRYAAGQSSGRLLPQLRAPGRRCRTRRGSRSISCSRPQHREGGR